MPVAGWGLDLGRGAADEDRMRARDPLRCVQATVAAGTACFRLWTDPAGGEDEGVLDFGARAAAFRAGRPGGPVLHTRSTPGATYLRGPGAGGWMRVHSAHDRHGTWEPFGVLDVLAALDALEPREPPPAQRGALQLHVGRLSAERAAGLAAKPATVARRLRPLVPAGGAAEVQAWLDSRLRLHRLRYRVGTAAAPVLVHVDLSDFARPRPVVPPSHAQPVNLDRVRHLLREAA
jgi:hypothetical protein